MDWLALPPELVVLSLTELDPTDLDNFFIAHPVLKNRYYHFFQDLYQAPRTQVLSDEEAIGGECRELVRDTHINVLSPVFSARVNFGIPELTVTVSQLVPNYPVTGDFLQGGMTLITRKIFSKWWILYLLYHSDTQYHDGTFVLNDEMRRDFKEALDEGIYSRYTEILGGRATPEFLDYMYDYYILRLIQCQEGYCLTDFRQRDWVVETSGYHPRNHEIGRPHSFQSYSWLDVVRDSIPRIYSYDLYPDYAYNTGIVDLLCREYLDIMDRYIRFMTRNIIIQQMKQTFQTQYPDDWGQRLAHYVEGTWREFYDARKAFILADLQELQTETAGSGLN